MIKVWILIVLLSGDARGYGTNGTLVVDNIADRTNCERLAQIFKQAPNQTNSTYVACVDVWKANQ